MGRAFPLGCRPCMSVMTSGEECRAANRLLLCHEHMRGPRRCSRSRRVPPAACAPALEAPFSLVASALSMISGLLLILGCPLGVEGLSFLALSADGCRCICLITAALDTVIRSLVMLGSSVFIRTNHASLEDGRCADDCERALARSRQCQRQTACSYSEWRLIRPTTIRRWHSFIIESAICSHGVLHPQPRQALVVGLGGGATAGSVSRFPGVELDVIELAESVVQGPRSGFAPSISTCCIVRMRISASRMGATT